MVESRALLKLRAPKGLRGFESLPHRFITQCRVVKLSVVHRLDGYEVEKPEIFERVIEFIEGKMMPIMVLHAVSRIADINSEDRLFDDSVALAMPIDMFTERGFHVTADVTRIGVPLRVDLQTG